MTKVIRQPVFNDSPTAFDCALDASEASPAAELLFREDEGAVNDIDLRPTQWEIFDDLLEAVAWGEDLPRARHNYLHDGLWELKVLELRATFYDTDGQGSYVPKSGREAIEVGKGPRRIYEPDEMDSNIRLGHWFVKTTQKTPQGDMDAAKRIRREDLQHDNRTDDTLTVIEGPEPKAIA